MSQTRGVKPGGIIVPNSLLPEEMQATIKRIEAQPSPQNVDRFALKKSELGSTSGPAKLTHNAVVHGAEPTTKALGAERVLGTTSISAVAKTNAIYGPTPVRVDDEIELVKASAPSVSPDGSKTLFLQSSVDWSKGGRVSQLMIQPTDGGPAKPLLDMQGVSAPQWSPDGKWIAFLKSTPTEQRASDSKDLVSLMGAAQNMLPVGKESRPQLYVVSADGGEPIQVTSTPRGVQTKRPEGVSGFGMKVQPFVWGPDSSRVYFLSEDAPDTKQILKEKAGFRTSRAFEGPHGQTRAAWVNVWSADVVTQKNTQVTKEAALIYDMDLSPQGDQLVVGFRRENARNAGNLAELGLVDLQKGKIAQITDNDVPEWGTKFSPSGDRVAYLSPDDKTWELAEPKIWVKDLKSGDVRNLSEKFPGTIDQFWWAPDGNSVLINGGWKTTQGIYRIDANSGEVTPVLNRPGSVSDVSVSRDGKTATVVWSDVLTPPDVYKVDLAGHNQMERLSRLNPRMEELTKAQFQMVSWKSPDGLEIEGLLFLPPNHEPEKSGKLPLVLQIHGGPRSVSANTWSGEKHVWANMGYASLWPNPRGGKAYGDPFIQGNRHDIGGGDFQDIMSGVDHLIEKGLVDEDRLAVRGWSYGGILGSWTITQTERFKAAMLGAGVMDWNSEYGQGFSHDVRLWYIGGTPWDNPEGYRQMSAQTHVANVTTPTLLMHGDKDIVCTPEQSQNFFNALFERGVPSRLLQFHGEPHSLGRPASQRERLVEEIAWMEKHLHGEDWDDPFDLQKITALPIQES